MIDLLSKYKTISIIGMAKNVGKTTTLNYLISKLYGKKKIGLTSIGRDGEDIDIVTNTSKPKIYIEKGTIVATARNCLNNSDCTKQILETTNINTPLGEVVIFEALSDGFVDLAGPSFNAQMKIIENIFYKYDVDLTFIDGAISRKGLADNYVSEAIIFCTGASYSSNMSKVVADTKFYVDLLSQKAIDDITLKNKFRMLMYEANICIINKNDEVKKLHLKTALNSSKEIVNQLNKDSNYLLIKGALSQDLIKSLIDNKDKFNYLNIVVSNSTKCIFDYKIYSKLKNINISILVLDNTNLLCLTYNPSSPYGYEFDEIQFKNQLQKVISLPIYNVMREKL